MRKADRLNKVLSCACLENFTRVIEGELVGSPSKGACRCLTGGVLGIGEVGVKVRGIFC